MTSANPGISAMEPLLPDSAGLAEPAMALDREANALGGRLHPITRRSMAELLRTTNTYHSNLIEGHGTRPRDIELALEGRLSSAPEKRTLQQEARAHIEVQRAVERRFESREPVAVTSPDFLRFLHREFYELMPDEWRKVRSHDGTRELTVLPGELRQEEVDVGRHVPVVGIHLSTKATPPTSNKPPTIVVTPTVSPNSATAASSVTSGSR